MTITTRKRGGLHKRGLATEHNMADAQPRQKTTKLPYDDWQATNKYLSGMLPTSTGVRQSCLNRSSALVSRRRRVIIQKTWWGKRNGSAINNTTTAHRQRRGGRSQSIAGSHGCTALQWPLSGAGPPRAQTHRDRAND